MEIQEAVMEGLLAAAGPFLFSTLFLAVLAWMSWNMSRHIRPEGRMRRGVPVWRRDLDPALVPALSLLPAQVEEPWGWARREDDLLLLRVDPNKIGPNKLRFQTSLPYVALIRLDWEAPRITYRQPLGTTLFILPHLVVLTPFTLLMAWVNHRAQAPAIDAALAELALDASGGAQV